MDLGRRPLERNKDKDMKLATWNVRRPRLRWINDVEDDLRKLGVKRWRTKALERGMGINYKGSQGQTKRAVVL
jgi:hypothetical protein